jgi:hypothetical protein
MQALEMQAARHWAIHERYITKIDVHKNSYSLKHAFKKIQQYQIEETEIRQRKLTVARKVAANSLTLKMQEAEKLAKEKERIKLGLSNTMNFRISYQIAIRRPECLLDVLILGEPPEAPLAPVPLVPAAGPSGNQLTADLHTRWLRKIKVTADLQTASIGRNRNMFSRVEIDG